MNMITQSKPKTDTEEDILYLWLRKTRSELDYNIALGNGDEERILGILQGLKLFESEYQRVKYGKKSKVCWHCERKMTPEYKHVDIRVTFGGGNGTIISLCHGCMGMFYERLWEE